MTEGNQNWELRYDQELRALKFSVSGRFPRHSIMFFHKTICESIVEMDAKIVLADLYDITLDYDLSSLDLSLIPQLYESYSVTNKLYIAIITPKSSEYIDTFLDLQQICNEYSYNVKLFENKTAANLWIEEQSLSF